MSATPDPATPLLEPPGVPAPPSGGRRPADPPCPPDLREPRPRLSRAGREPGPVWLAPPQLPPWPVVWLALDDGPEGGKADRPVRFWGLAVDDGRGEPRPEAITAGFDEQDDRRAWERFVARAGEIIERHPEARWVHYSAREKDRVRDRAARHGAPPGFLARLEEAFFELLSRGVRRAVRLPLDSCSLRQVAGLAGFQRRSPRPSPAGPPGHLLETRTGADPVERARTLREIAESNTEDLLAMRAVWRWMLEQGPRGYCG